jgi:eukaryotic-like serine/threonine-protein kinase
LTDPRVSEPVGPGRVLGGRYRLTREIARGGMASVWEAEDPLLSRRVAVKLLDPHLGLDEALRTRFRREAVAAARLAHPAIVATYDTGDDDGVAYIVMELVDGVTLRELLDRRGTFDIGDAVAIATQVADALAHAHERGLVHRDVKPGNVLVQRDEHVKVTDFGIAKAAGTDGDLTRDGAVVGTARYLSPEQLNGRPADERADVYALGLVLYEMLCGHLPFESETDVAAAVARLTADPPLLSRLRPEMPPRLSAAVQHALARDPDDRTPSARSLRDEIAPFRSAGADAPADAAADATVPHGIDRAALAPPPSHAVQAVAVSGARLWLVLAAVAVFAAGAAAGYFGWRALFPTEKASTTAAPAPTGPVRIVSAHDFDPLGDGGEDSKDVANAIDGNPATSWSTEHYVTRDLGGKKGVGLRLDLDGRHAIRSVDVDAEQIGWNAQLFVSDQVWTAAPTGPPAAEGNDLGRNARFTPAGPARGSHVLLWITGLPEPSGASPSSSLQISEVRVAG